jgi:hypothetical protein
MHQVFRKGHRGKRDGIPRPKYGGTFTIYDGKEDAISHGITNIKFWKDSSIKIGDWIEYPDGQISECCKVFQQKVRKDQGLLISTRLNTFSQNQRDVVSTLLPYRISTAKTRPETITTSRLEFAEEWLLNGTAIDKACSKHLWQSKGYNGKELTSRSYKSFAYLTISLPWFDELLKKNRLIRDRYMTLVGALSNAGVDEAYIAQQLKNDIESANPKLHINAINNAIELLEASAQKKRIPIEASWKVETPIPKQIPENTNINSILEDTLHEHVRSENSKTERVETVSFVSEDRRGTSLFGQTEGDTSVSTGSPDKDRLSVIAEVPSPNKV